MQQHIPSYKQMFIKGFWRNAPDYVGFANNGKPIYFIIGGHGDERSLIFHFTIDLDSSEQNFEDILGKNTVSRVQRIYLPLPPLPEPSKTTFLGAIKSLFIEPDPILPPKGQYGFLTDLFLRRIQTEIDQVNRENNTCIVFDPKKVYAAPNQNDGIVLTSANPNQPFKIHNHPTKKKIQRRFVSGHSPIDHILPPTTPPRIARDTDTWPSCYTPSVHESLPLPDLVLEGKFLRLHDYEDAKNFRNFLAAALDIGDTCLSI